ncbi:MAG: TIGR00730 family Rossman fold protein [Planctomycetota bacterium]
MSEIQRVCVFCGSHEGKDPIYVSAAQSLGKALVRRNWGLVYGGGSVGLMGVIADTVLAAGGEVYGVIPDALARKEIRHEGLTKQFKVPNMHARKAKMTELSDAFIAMPGGYGTLEELFEVITWAQLGLHDKPIGVLNAAGYYDGLLGCIDSAVLEGFIRPEHRKLILSGVEPDALLDGLARHQPPTVEKLIKAEES